MHPKQITSLSLLERVKRGDSVAWSEFSRIYESVLRTWCFRWGLQSADTDDLIQDTLLVLIGEIHRFRHRGTGSFRGWMRTVAWHCLCAATARSEKKLQAEKFSRILSSERGRQTLEDEIDRVYELQMLEQAMQNVTHRVSSSTWLAFRQTAILGRTAKHVSEVTGQHPDAIYAARARVQRLIQQELKRLKSAHFR